jgi:hypothetical protein
MLTVESWWKEKQEAYELEIIMAAKKNFNGFTLDAISSQYGHRPEVYNLIGEIVDWCREEVEKRYCRDVGIEEFDHESDEDGQYMVIVKIGHDIDYDLLNCPLKFGIG